MSLAEPFYPNYLASDPADPRAEAHRLCRVALKAGPATGRALVVRVGCRFTLVAGASDGRLVGFRSVSHGPVLLAASHAEAANANGAAAARVVRAAAAQVAERARLESLVSARGAVVGATGIAETVIALAARGASQATIDEVRAVTETLGITWAERRVGRSDAWIAPMMIGAAVLAAILEQLDAQEIVAEEMPAPRAVS
jgi:hypothetical protein